MAPVAISVYGELLIDKGGRIHLSMAYEHIHRAPVVPHREVVEFVRARKLHGRGIGFAAAKALGIEYE